MDSKNDEKPKTYKRINLWSDADTQLMLDLCGSYLYQIGPKKKFKNKKDMWAKISTRFPDKSAKQCEERFKTVLRRKKTKLDPVIATAIKQDQANYMALHPEVQLNIENNDNYIIENNDDYNIENNDNIKVEPEVPLGFEINEEYKEEYNEINEEYNESAMDACLIDECTNLTVQETLWKIAEQTEVANERRHREKMEEMEKITSLLQQILQDRGTTNF